MISGGGLLIRVCDSIMGAGKTSAAINYINAHPNKRYIYVTPYLDEAYRVKIGCTGVEFEEPTKTYMDGTVSKMNDTMRLIDERKNIVTSHSLFTSYSLELLEKIRSSGYTLFIDESLDSIGEADVYEYDVEMLVNGGHIVMDDKGIYHKGVVPYPGGSLRWVMDIVSIRNIVILNCDNMKNKICYWMLPPELILSFEDVFVMTYLFEGQTMAYMFKLYGIGYKMIGTTCNGKDSEFTDDVNTMPEYTRSISSKIHICDNSKLNHIGKNKYSLSMNWMRRYGRKSEQIEQLRKNIYNYFRNIEGDHDSDRRMWSSFKFAEKWLVGKGYSKCFTAFNLRATNDYSDKDTLAYIANVFMNADIKQFLSFHGLEIDEDSFALSCMVQWIYRSAIRKGQEIWIYVPSKRMRDLLVKWIADLERRWI